MDDADQARAYSEADFDDAHDAFVAFGLDRCGRMKGMILDVGCGAADPTVRFARAHPATRIVAVDASSPMLELAARRVGNAGLADRITFEQRFLPDDELAARRFDGVISNSLLHHLADPAALWATVASCVGPGAPVVVMDLVRPDGEAEVDRLVACYTAGAPEVLRRDFHNSLHAAYRLEEVRAQLDDAGLGHLRVEQVTDRHLLVSGFQRG
jgi:2-polyprenyl-3-methyl-5-hydroxy-6-metoxy-1,4-benzoquinol methylase